MYRWILTAICVGVVLALAYWSVQIRRKAPRELFPAPKAVEPVGGWLLFLCVILVFLYPSTLIGYKFSDVEAIAAEFPRAMTYALIDSVVRTAILVYSIYTGVRLWRVRRGAVAGAKRFLLVVWIYVLTSQLSVFAVGFPREVTIGPFRRFLWRFPLFSLHLLAWWIYLTRSKRVATTFRVHGA